MIWYGLIPVGKQNPGSLATVAAGCEFPQTTRFIAHDLAKTLRIIRRL